MKRTISIDFHTFHNAGELKAWLDDLATDHNLDVINFEGVDGSSQLRMSVYATELTDGSIVKDIVVNIN